MKLFSWLNRPIPNWLYRWELRSMAKDTLRLARRYDILYRPEAMQIRQIAFQLREEADTNQYSGASLTKM